MKLPSCPMCGLELRHAGSLWRCDGCGFYFRVRRGAASPTPLWQVGSEEGVEGGDAERAEIEQRYNVRFTDEGWEYWKKHKDEIRRMLGIKS